MREAERIASRAGGFVAGAAFCGLIGLICLFYFFISPMESDPNSMSGPASWKSLYLAGAFFAAAIWLYLIAQIIHIRALLAKK